MREFEFPTEFKSSGRDGVRLSVHTGPSHTAKEFIKDDFITDPVVPFLDLLSQWKGLEGQYKVQALEKRVLAFEMSAGLMNEPWQVASILGLIDSATFLQDIDDDPFITSVVVEAGNLPDLSLESSFKDMDRFAEQCRAVLSQFLTDGFSVEGEVQHAWPQDAEEYLFDIKFATSAPISAETGQQMSTVFSRIETSLAGAAFESENSPEYFLEEGLLPFPVNVKIGDQEIHYSIETPPSDISIPLVLFRDIATERFGVGISGWEIEIRERW